MIDFWQEIYGTIKRNRLRTFLTGFSVSWGIFILIVLLGAGNGLLNAFNESSKGVALNSVRIFSGTTTKPYQGLSEGREIQFSNADLDVLNDNFKSNIIKSGATISRDGITVSNGDEYVSLSITGVFPNYTSIERVNLARGRFIDELDIDQKRKVVVLSQDKGEILFGKRTDPIGQYVNAGGIMFLVVGLTKNDDESRQSNEAYVPFTTSQVIYNQGDSISDLCFTTKGLDTQEANDKFEKSYRKAMSVTHHFDPEDESAIWVWNRLTQYLQQEQGNRILTNAIWIIGIFTLLSGIVGVSNIMLITVRERTREFGIRKALGAKPSSILRLIIAESIAITTLFGYIGMFLGIAATEYLNKVAGDQKVDVGVFSTTVFSNPTVDIHVAIQATVALIIAGTLAGFFPARKATRIRPIEALRAE